MNDCTITNGTGSGVKDEILLVLRAMRSIGGDKSD